MDFKEEREKKLSWPGKYWTVYKYSNSGGKTKLWITINSGVKDKDSIYFNNLAFENLKDDFVVRELINLLSAALETKCEA